MTDAQLVALIAAILYAEPELPLTTPNEAVDMAVTIFQVAHKRMVAEEPHDLGH